MSNSYKPGGGNKPQPYIPAGNGDKSGEYTNKSTNQTSINQKRGVMNCNIRNKRFSYNFCHSSLVQKVTDTFISDQGVSIPKIGKPNSVSKKIIDGYVVTERYYNSKGEVYLDIDYTCHGNPKRHPIVPHIHRWNKNEAGILERGGWEVFQ
ncbi:MAG: hypothetical protein MJZ37_03050 [Bacilli bacterium]|nr:hypothetical protein [Bacilli bacterium]